MEQTFGSLAAGAGPEFGGLICCPNAVTALTTARENTSRPTSHTPVTPFRRRSGGAVCWLRPCLTGNLLRYFITDRRLCGGLPALLDAIRRQMGLGIEYIQIREKDLSARELWELTRAVVSSRGASKSKILVNDRADVAIGAGADGVHLPARAPVKTLPGLIVARSCHTEAEVRNAIADFVTFSPVFPSPGKGQPVGLDALRGACRYSIPVFALGGVTRENADSCIAAGAAGIAGIRLFLSSADAKELDV